MTRNDLPEYFKSMGFKVGAEIGVYRGWFTKRLCDAGLKVYGVDPWGFIEGHARRQPHYEEAKQTLKPYIDGGQCELIRKSSMEAVKDFADSSLDFVYIDADHRFKYIAEDIYEWTWRVREGGVVSGHDYINHVKSIVDAYTIAFGVDNLVILEEKFPSWMWIKKTNGAN